MLGLAAFKMAQSPPSVHRRRFVLSRAHKIEVTQDVKTAADLLAMSELVTASSSARVRVIVASVAALSAAAACYALLR